MKTAFSTLGCPNWSFSEIFSTAYDLGFDGIEFRGVENEIYTPNVKEFSKENIEGIKERFKKASLEIPVFSSAALMSDRSQTDIALKEAYDYIELCNAFNSPFVRVLADKSPAPSGYIDENETVKNLDKVTGYAKEKNVSILIETNGIYSNTDNLQRLLKKVNRDNLFVIWDVHHTYRYGNETPSKSVQNLAEYIRHVHLKDSTNDGQLKYKLLGDGDVPVKQALAELKKIDYNGYLCLEWVKRWAVDLAEPGIAFPNFLFYVKDALQSIL